MKDELLRPVFILHPSSFIPYSATMDDLFTSIESRRTAAVDGLKRLLRFASISAQPDHAQDVQACAQWLAGEFRQCGLQASVEPTGGHPVVLARSEHRPGRPTVLLYGHYDVQPPEPLDQWRSPPFEPTIRDGAIYARGAADDKGQVWAHVEALRAWQQHGGPPVNVIVLIEGEEEIGSENLERFIAGRRDELRADIAVISDTNQFARDVPAITYGLRGLAYAEVFIEGPSHDLHSGIYGGAVPNPANILCQVLASLHDTDGRVNIDGFYDDVGPLSSRERDMWAGLPFDDKQFARDLGLGALCGEMDYTTLERRWARPTLDINGLTSGYQGHGAKTVIPARASAKVSMRLVADQDPQKVQAAFERAVRQRCPNTVKVSFAWHGLSPAALVPLDSPGIRLAERAVEAGFGRPPVLVREGGSIPVVGLIKAQLGIDTLLVGFGLPDDRVHSPNEKFDLDALYRGTRTAAALYQELSAL